MEKDKLELSDDRQVIILNSVKEDLQRVYDHFRQLEYQNEYLKKENERLKFDHYKDEQLANLEKKYEVMKEMCHLGFPITKEEHEKINAWIDKQMKKHPGNGGAIGGRFSYEFVPTGIGTSGTVIDGFTGDKFNFQELG